MKLFTSAQFIAGLTLGIIIGRYSKNHFTKNCIENNTEELLYLQNGKLTNKKNHLDEIISCNNVLDKNNYKPNNSILDTENTSTIESKSELKILEIDKNNESELIDNIELDEELELNKDSDLDLEETNLLELTEDSELDENKKLELGKKIKIPKFDSNETYTQDNYEKLNIYNSDSSDSEEVILETKLIP